MENILNHINIINSYVATKTRHYINNLDILEQNKLQKCNDNDELFTLAYKFGILPLLRYLYEYCGIMYNYNLLMNTACTLSSEENENYASVSSNGLNSSLNIIFGGKNQYGVMHCYKYLQYIKKYSKYKSKNKQFYYTYGGTKYMDNEILDNMIDGWINQLCCSNNNCKKDYMSENPINNLTYFNT